LLVALAPWPAGFIAGCGPSCSEQPTCKGNQAVLCVMGTDGDGPDTRNEYEDCPQGSTCTERPNDQPVCVLGSQPACDTVGAQQCIGGLPAECIALSDGSKAWASTNSVQFTTCLMDRTCVVDADMHAICVSASMTPCDTNGQKGCGDGAPSTCTALADGSLVWDADIEMLDSAGKPAADTCPSGSTCAMVQSSQDGVHAECVFPTSCQNGDPAVCTAAAVGSYCVQLTDGSWVRDAVQFFGCTGSNNGPVGG
jgi:hypothetical protein